MVDEATLSQKPRRAWLLAGAALALALAFGVPSAVALQRQRKMIISHDGVIRVPRLGQDWRCQDQSGRVAGTALSVVRCRREPLGDSLQLLAKVYRVAQSAVLPPEQLLREVYRRHYEQLFKDIRYQQGPPLLFQGLRGVQVHLTAKLLASGEAVELEEHLFVSGDQVLLLSVAGQPARVQGHAAQIRRFFQETQLRHWLLLGAGVTTALHLPPPPPAAQEHQSSCSQGAGPRCA